MQTEFSVLFHNTYGRLRGLMQSTWLAVSTLKNTRQMDAEKQKAIEILETNGIVLHYLYTWKFEACPI